MNSAQTSSNVVEEADASIAAQNSSSRLDSSVADTKPDATNDPPQAKNKQRHSHKKHSHRTSKSKMKRSGKSRKSLDDDSSDDSSDSAYDSDLSVSSSETASDNGSRNKPKSTKRRSQAEKLKAKTKSKSKRSRHAPSSSDDDSEDVDSATDSDRHESPQRSKKKAKRSSARNDSDESEDEDEASETEADDLATEIATLKTQLARLELRRRSSRRRSGTKSAKKSTRDRKGEKKGKKSRRGKATGKKVRKASTLEFKRVDELWDSSIHDYKLTESAEAQEGQFDEYIFTVRRKFDWENKFKNVVVDIKSKPLREALQEIMKDVRGISLVEEQPSVDPNMLFLYLEELRVFTKKTLKTRASNAKKRRARRNARVMRAHAKVLISYLDEDYEETKKTLYPMLEAGNITFDLLWALFKPNTIAFTSTYGSVEHPRAFKVDYANRESSFMRGEWYCIEGRYLEYDGKTFGLGDFDVDIEHFKGARKITSLSAYPLQNHKDPESIKKQLIERGKQFVSLDGMSYRFHHGLAFMKKKKTVAKVNINGRIMIDPTIFRRMNPNYSISTIKRQDEDNIFGSASDEDEDSSCCQESDDEQLGGAEGLTTRDSAEATMYKVVMDQESKPRVIEVSVDEQGNEIRNEDIEELGVDAETKREFSEEELLIASSVVVGFAFSEKLWLEFTLSGVRDIDWNEGAFESLVLPPNQKSIVRALVESHKFHAAKTIDDVVQGKGRGLVAVLHGPPGTGKTLTAEGIAELLKCPLYMVSAGELGTDPRMLESELQKILDIAHSWGAVLLLDEADVFLEKREVHDIHRNALVSIFLRLLEYFQGILFLTTNRVETFDDAFQSRIHVALRYGELTTAAKRTVWKMFLDKVKTMECRGIAGSDASADGSSPKVQRAEFSEAEYDDLARCSMNGRQIKNAVRTAQALAVDERTAMNMGHIKRVLDVAESFDRDLRGGTGYVEAMRSYT